VECARGSAPRLGCAIETGKTGVDDVIRLLRETGLVSLNAGFGVSESATGANEGPSAVIVGEGRFIVDRSKDTSVWGGTAGGVWESPDADRVTPVSCDRSPESGPPFWGSHTLPMLTRAGVKFGVARPWSPLGPAARLAADTSISRAPSPVRVSETAGLSRVTGIWAIWGVTTRRAAASTTPDLAVLEESGSNAYAAGIVAALMDGAADAGTAESAFPSRVRITAVVASSPMAMSSTPCRDRSSAMPSDTPRPNANLVPMAIALRRVTVTAVLSTAWPASRKRHHPAIPGLPRMQVARQEEG
jgi:hypothetical protein